MTRHYKAIKQDTHLGKAAIVSSRVAVKDAQGSPDVLLGYTQHSIVFENLKKIAKSKGVTIRKESAQLPGDKIPKVYEWFRLQIKLTGLDSKPYYETGERRIKVYVSNAALQHLGWDDRDHSFALAVGTESIEEHYTIDQNDKKAIAFHT